MLRNRQYFEQMEPGASAAPSDSAATACAAGSSNGCTESAFSLQLKQLRYYARFIIVCLLLGKKEVGLIWEIQTKHCLLTAS